MTLFFGLNPQCMKKLVTQLAQLNDVFKDILVETRVALS